MSPQVRPVSIKRFETLFLASVALTVLAIMLNLDILRNQALAQSSAAAGPIAGVIVTLLVNLPLWFFIARRASNVAKWILLVLLAFGLVSLPWTFEEVFAVSTSYSLLNVVAFVLSLASTAMLFTRESVAWLTSHGAVTPVDPGVFS
jgi:hypothetical protein